MHSVTVHFPMTSSLFDAAYREDPFAVYAALRADRPVVWNEAMNAWIVTGGDDVRHVFQTPDIFSSDRVGLGRARFPDPELAPLFDAVETLMVQRDEPEHSRLRRLVSKAFGKTELDRFEGMIGACIDDLLQPVEASGHMEFVRAFAIPLPVRVISEIVGIPGAMRGQVKAWCDDFAYVALNFYAKISDRQLSDGMSAVKAFRAYLRDEATARRTHPRADLLSALVAAEDDGDRLSFDELLANTILLLSAGNETTTVLLSNLMRRLAVSPDLQTELRDDPSRIPAAIEESLRHEPPLHFLARIVTKETVLAGETLSPGESVLIFLGAAGRDPELFDDPNTFSLARGKIQHLSFGSGPHVCVGLQLARLEARMMVERLLETFSEIRLGEGDLGLGPNLNLRNVERLPLILRPR